MNTSEPERGDRAAESQPSRVLFVCLGNICRSPAAEGVLKHFVTKAGLESGIEIDSAGTAGYHIGKPADARMRRAASLRGYDLTSRARQVQPWDLHEFHWVIAMDRENLADLKTLVPQPQAEVRLLSSFLTGSWPTDVPDPYYGGDEGFEFVLDMLEAASPAILEACRRSID